MKQRRERVTRAWAGAALWLAFVGVLAGFLRAEHKSAGVLAVSTMPRLGTVDTRYLSFNVEMVEVTGGRFWKPYKAIAGSPEAAKPNAARDPNRAVGGDSDLYRFRPPIDLSNPRLRKLAAALGPSYLRVSGTWQNSTYFQNDDNPALKQPPEGFKGVLTRVAWKGVIDFSKAIDARLVTSVAISPGVRNSAGVWTPSQARAVFDYTKSLGSDIAAAEFMNEPTFPGPGGAPQGYDAAAFAKDVKAFEAFLRTESPKALFLGPGGVGEGVSLAPGGVKMKLLATDDLLQATGPVFDAFSYHFYGAVSRRCMGNTTVDQALSAEWLDRTDVVEQFYAALRNKYLPGKPLWLTETGEAACGGDRFAGEFVDAFRFVNQLGSLSQKGVQVVIHNTLASSDYGLLNEDTLDPRPDYWAALLWKRTMGSTVLDPGASPNDPSLRIFSHCLEGEKGGVAVVALNADATHDASVTIPMAGARRTLTAPEMTSAAALLNGTELQAGPDGSLPPLNGMPAPAGTLHLAPGSITFLTFPTAHNKSCA